MNLYLALSHLAVGHYSESRMGVYTIEKRVNVNGKYSWKQLEIHLRGGRSNRQFTYGCIILQRHGCRMDRMNFLS